MAGPRRGAAAPREGGDAGGTILPTGRFLNRKVAGGGREGEIFGVLACGGGRILGDVFRDGPGTYGNIREQLENSGEPRAFGGHSMGVGTRRAWMKGML